MNKFVGLLFCSCFCTYSLFSQTTNIRNGLTLYEVIELAREQSPAALQAVTVKENRYWQYKTYQSNYFPQLVLNGSNEFSREVVATRQNDGTYAFPQVNQNLSALSLSLEQQIGFSGSRIFLSSSLNRFDNFYNNTAFFSGNPAFIGLTQPLFFFNWLKWDKKIAPLQYEESKREYVEEMEQIAVRVTDLFFDMLLSQASLDIAKKNLAINEDLYQMAQDRASKTSSSESEQLQLELTVMRARQQVAKAELDLETNTLRLKSFIGVTDDDPLSLVPPSTIPDFKVDTETALAEAHKNRRASVAFKRRKLEAAKGVAWARGSGGLDANIQATFGLTNRGDVLSEVYQTPDDQQAVMINFSVPVMDWGRQKSRYKTAEANQKLTDYTVAQDQVNFEQEVITHVRMFSMRKQQVTISEKSDQIAQKRYAIAQRRYVLGEISITDLNIAMQEKDEAKRSYIASLEEFWKAYYQLRKLTLYDFEHNISIIL
ncbi:outer membrane efflux protein [Flammeovirgaceae bacterium 311]|nr:outer membrane efflux protein [Flammeovirgaceae bacterium 311]